MRLKVIALILTVPLQANAAAGETAEPSRSHTLGSISARFLQTSYALEILTTGECAKYAVRPHSASRDYDEVITVVSNLMRISPSKFDKSLRADANERRRYAETELATLSRQIVEGGSASLDFRCGMLLGMASMTYLDARAVWAGFNKLEMPRWTRP